MIFFKGKRNNLHKLNFADGTLFLTIKIWMYDKFRKNLKVKYMLFKCWAIEIAQLCTVVISKFQ